MDTGGELNTVGDGDTEDGLCLVVVDNVGTLGDGAELGVKFLVAFVDGQFEK